MVQGDAAGQTGIPIEPPDVFPGKIVFGMTGCQSAYKKYKKLKIMKITEN
jgi:hypothetical protein